MMENTEKLQKSFDNTELQKSSDVHEVINALKKINQKLVENPDIVGVYSVRIGFAYVYVKENENETEDFLSTKGHGELFFKLNQENENKLFYIYAICKESINFFDGRGRLSHGRYFTEDEITSIRLFNDANKLIEDMIGKMYENTEKRMIVNKDQIHKISGINCGGEIK